MYRCRVANAPPVVAQIFEMAPDDALPLTLEARHAEPFQVEPPRLS
jgi:hypothetical protein